jgi:hypothetical protein
MEGSYQEVNIAIYRQLYVHVIFSGANIVNVLNVFQIILSEFSLKQDKKLVTKQEFYHFFENLIYKVILIFGTGWTERCTFAAV